MRFMWEKNESFYRAETLVHEGEIKNCRSKGKLFGGSKAGKYQRKKCMWKVERRWKKSETNKKAKKRETGKEALSTVSFGVLCYS